MHFLDLPTEVLFLVFLSLDPRSLLHLACTCRVLHELLDDEMIWKEVYFKEFPLAVLHRVHQGTQSFKRLCTAEGVKVEGACLLQTSSLSINEREEPSDTALCFLGDEYIGKSSFITALVGLGNFPNFHTTSVTTYSGFGVGGSRKVYTLDDIPGAWHEEFLSRAPS
mmetsp:Transcript_292/g.632  ORF Transcript_292/g.632 Transcript_292/m.632 type:complete len:167 (-) Transcript_292:118-618(-)